MYVCTYTGTYTHTLYIKINFPTRDTCSAWSTGLATCTCHACHSELINLTASEYLAVTPNTCTRA